METILVPLRTNRPRACDQGNEIRGQEAPVAVSKVTDSVFYIGVDNAELDLRTSTARLMACATTPSSSWTRR